MRTQVFSFLRTFFNRFIEYRFWGGFGYCLAGGLCVWIVVNLIILVVFYILYIDIKHSQFDSIIVLERDFFSTAISIIKHHNITTIFFSDESIGFWKLFLLYSSLVIALAVVPYAFVSSMLLRLCYALFSTHHSLSYLLTWLITYVMINSFVNLGAFGFSTISKNSRQETLFRDPLDQNNLLGLLCCGSAGVCTWIIREVIVNGDGPRWMRRFLIVPWKIWRRRGAVLLVLVFLADLMTYRVVIGSSYPINQTLLGWRKIEHIATNVVNASDTQIKTPVLPCMRYSGFSRNNLMPWGTAQAYFVKILVDLPRLTPAPRDDCTRPIGPIGKRPDRAMVRIGRPYGIEWVERHVAYLAEQLVANGPTRSVGTIHRERHEGGPQPHFADVAFIIRANETVDVIALCDKDQCIGPVLWQAPLTITYTVSAEAFWADPAGVDAGLRALALSFIER